MSRESTPSAPMPPEGVQGDSTLHLEATLPNCGSKWPAFLLRSNQNNTIGRAAEADIVVADRLTSRGHASIQQDNTTGEWQIHLESRNGTWVDGQRVTEMWLRPEMSIRLVRLSLSSEFLPDVRRKAN